MRWRLALVIMAALMTAVMASIVALALAVNNKNPAPSWFPELAQHPLGWAIGATAGVAGAILLTWWASRMYDRGLAKAIPAEYRLEKEIVRRPDEVDKVVRALRGSSGKAARTVALHGVGGFGKTTVAKMVWADQRVLRRFGKRVHWVPLGQNLDAPELAAVINGLLENLGHPAAFVVPGQAAQQLASVLAKEPRRLLIIDDVWDEEQLDFFPVAGRSVRLITTRNSRLCLGDATAPIEIGEMSEKEARELLLGEWQGIPSEIASALLEETGLWPVKMWLAKKFLADRLDAEDSAAEAAAALLNELRQGGDERLDELSDVALGRLDISDPANTSNPERRAQRIGPMLKASIDLLSEEQQGRLGELVVFMEGEVVPISLVRQFWHVTGLLDESVATALCTRLAALALVTMIPGGGLAMHGVIRSHISRKVDGARLKEWHRALINAAAKQYGVTVEAAPAVQATSAVVDHGADAGREWWSLPTEARYMREHLVRHLIDAGDVLGAEYVATNLRWVAARLQAAAGPAGPYADLTLVARALDEQTNGRAKRQLRLLGQAADLLSPTVPRRSVTDILYSRVSDDPDWGQKAKELASNRTLPGLTNKWSLPDLPDSSLRLTLYGQNNSASAVAIASDGTWFATVGRDDIADRDVICTWDAATGQRRRFFPAQTYGTDVLAISPNGEWLATGGASDGKVRTWDSDTGDLLRTLEGHRGAVTSVAIAPNGEWLATGSYDGTVRNWKATGEPLRILVHRDEPNRATTVVMQAAITPDGTQIITHDNRKTLRIWEAATGLCCHLSSDSGYPSWVSVIAIAPKGKWFAIGGYDLAVRIFDASTGKLIRVLTDPRGSISAVAISPDGEWLITSGPAAKTRIWDAPTGQPGSLAVSREEINSVAFAPNGEWLATAGDNGSLAMLDAATGETLHSLNGHKGRVRDVAIAPDSAWLASVGSDGSLRTWNSANGKQRQVCDIPGKPKSSDSASFRLRRWAGEWWRTALGRTDIPYPSPERFMNAVAIGPDGKWLATADTDLSIRIWGALALQQTAIFAGRTEWLASIAIEPGGKWLVGCIPGLVRIWNVTTGHQGRTLHSRGHGYFSMIGVNAVAIAPDGRWLAATDDWTVQIWKAAEGQIWDSPARGRRYALTKDRIAASAVAIAPDSRWLAVAGWDGTIRIWDAEKKEVAAVMRTESKLNSCAWSPSGHLLAVAGSAGIHLFAFTD